MGQVEQLGTNGNQLAHGPSTRRGVHQLVMPVFVFVPPLLALLGPSARYPQGQRAGGS